MSPCRTRVICGVVTPKDKIWQSKTAVQKTNTKFYTFQWNRNKSDNLVDKNLSFYSCPWKRLPVSLIDAQYWPALQFPHHENKNNYLICMACNLAPHQIMWHNKHIYGFKVKAFVVFFLFLRKLNSRLILLHDFKLLISFPKFYRKKYTDTINLQDIKPWKHNVMWHD